MKEAAFLLLLCASACGPTLTAPARTAQASAAAPRVQVEEVMEAAARQVRRCYRSPQIATAGRQIVTRLRVRLTGDGQLAQLPVVVAQEGVTSGNRFYAGRMAEAAIEAVMRCAPLRLPGGIPQTRLLGFDLTFSPLAPA
ncbi:MAG TPA: hypothetical protein VF704_04610 [Allosphingosinicella sp.]